MNVPLSRRLSSVDWTRVERDLGEHGAATVRGVLSPGECRMLIGLFRETKRFRKWVDMERYRFGRGEYAYFAEPLPRLVSGLRTGLYKRLAPIANRAERELGGVARYPSSLGAYRRECRAAGQREPTPLLLHYSEGGFNCLHRDLYGDLRFPVQATLMLSRREEYEGGEFLIVENRPRRQSRAEVVTLEQGEMVLFFCAERPVHAVRSVQRAEVRHGVSRLRRGERYALGIIFHDAR